MTSLTLEQRKLLREALQEAGNRLVQLSQTSHGAIFDKVDAALALLDSLPQTDPAYPVPVSGEARTTDAWQPIETAPIDGKWIQLYGRHPRGGCDQITARWWAAHSGDEGCWQCGDDQYQPYLNPTHWMPLPPPPTKESQP